MNWNQVTRQDICYKQREISRVEKCVIDQICWYEEIPTLEFEKTDLIIYKRFPASIYENVQSKMKINKLEKQ